MNSLVTSAVVFGCVTGGLLLGKLLRQRLPEHHLSSESRDAVKIGAGLVGTMSALLLGLLVASAKSSYDAEKSEVTQMASKIAFLDRILHVSGEETRPAREQLKATLAITIANMWPGEQTEKLPPDAATAPKRFYFALQELPAQTEAQKQLKSQAIGIYTDLSQTRFLLIKQSEQSLPFALVVIVVFWLATTFISYGLMTPRNWTVLVALMLGAFSVSMAFYIVLELEHPFDGIMQISSDSMRSVLQQIGN